jgi:hypothetical protein
MVSLADNRSLRVLEISDRGGHSSGKLRVRGR